MSDHRLMRVSAARRDLNHRPDSDPPGGEPLIGDLDSVEGPLKDQLGARLVDYSDAIAGGFGTLLLLHAGAVDPNFRSDRPKVEANLGSSDRLTAMQPTRF